MGLHPIKKCSAFFRYLAYMGIGLYGSLLGSSDFKDVIWSRMESLEVIDVFCTASECATTFTSNFSTIFIFIIFHFLFMDFLILIAEMLARSSSGWVLHCFLAKT